MKKKSVRAENMLNRNPILITKMISLSTKILRYEFLQFLKFLGQFKLESKVNLAAELAYSRS